MSDEGDLYATLNIMFLLGLLFILIFRILVVSSEILEQFLQFKPLLN